MDLPITYRGVVYPWQCDHMGHMNVFFHARALIVPGKEDSCGNRRHG